MSVTKPGPFPLYFQKIDPIQLGGQVASLQDNERGALEGTVFQLAAAEGVQDLGWEWGKHHLFDSPNRLVSAFLERKKAYLQEHSGCSDRIADLVIRCCPLVDRTDINASVLDEIVGRAKCLSDLEKLKKQLNAKYSDLHLATSDQDDQLSRAFRSQEVRLLAMPGVMSEADRARVGHISSVLKELINGNYDQPTVRLILEKLLLKESLRPSTSDIQSSEKLMEIQAEAKRRIASCTLARADDNVVTKDIFVVPSSAQKKGKVKPLDPRSAAREVYAFHCDRMLGIGMTAPTAHLRVENLASRVDEIRRLFLSAQKSEKGKDPDTAKSIRDHACKLLNEADFPLDVRNAIFGEMYVLCGDNRCIDDLGQKLFFDTNGFQATDREKAVAIQNYMDSFAFKEHMHRFNMKGTVQIWLNDCQRGYEYIVKDPEGGAKLKTAPKTLAHLYAVLGMLKGSKDCSSGNTLVEFDPKEKKVVNFWDMDDERSMPLSHDFWHIRMWQMGLPQCAQPFDRAVLLMLTDPSIISRLKKLQSSPQISNSEYRTQVERLEKMTALFQSELQKEQIALTPRELFFALFQGSREDYMRVKEGFNNDKSFSEEGIRISPIELFEFHLPEMGRTAWYTGDGNEMKKVGENMRSLYFPDLP
ncbi:MAG: hypothetical protein JSS60_00935 [Verrucomicrobia bacterium]|nr:hypothetical protein [Verrucomicrobiota bacterium]